MIELGTNLFGRGLESIECGYPREYLGVAGVALKNANAMLISNSTLSPAAAMLNGCRSLHMRWEIKAKLAPHSIRGTRNLCWAWNTIYRALPASE
jgi:hypothetical protein